MKRRLVAQKAGQAASQGAAHAGARRQKSLERLRAAVERIVQLVPTSPGLVARLKRKKKLRLSVAAVAAEAGITRAALYAIYPEIVAEVKARCVSAPVPRLTTSEELVLALREENAMLQRSIADLISENAGLLFRVSVSEDKVKRLIDQRERRDRIKTNR